MTSLNLASSLWLRPNPIPPKVLLQPRPPPPIPLDDLSPIEHAIRDYIRSLDPAEQARLKWFYRAWTPLIDDGA